MRLRNTINSIASLDAGIHNPARLMIVYLLSKSKALDYLQLMSLTGLTSGNISTHLNKLQELGYISINKSFVGKKPNTSVKLTETGIQAYRQWGEDVLHALPEDTMRKLCTSLLNSVIVQKNKAFPVLEWYPYAIIGQPNFLLRDKYRSSVSLPPMDGEMVY